MKNKIKVENGEFRWIWGEFEFLFSKFSRGIVRSIFSIIFSISNEFHFMNKVSEYIIDIVSTAGDKLKKTRFPMGRPMI